MTQKDWSESESDSCFPWVWPHHRINTMMMLILNFYCHYDGNKLYRVSSGVEDWRWFELKGYNVITKQQATLREEKKWSQLWCKARIHTPLWGCIFILCCTWSQLNVERTKKNLGPMSNQAHCHREKRLRMKSAKVWANTHLQPDDRTNVANSTVRSVCRSFVPSVFKMVICFP